MDDIEDPRAAGTATTSNENGRSVVHVAGEFDVSNADVLREAFTACEGSVVLDAAGLRFIDSSGIAVLLQHAENSGAIDVRDAPAVLRRIIDISGLGHVLRVEP